MEKKSKIPTRIHTYNTYADDKLLNVEKMRYYYGNSNNKRDSYCDKEYDLENNSKKKQLNYINEYLKSLKENYFTTKKNVANETLREYTTNGVIIIK